MPAQGTPQQLGAALGTEDMSKTLTLANIRSSLIRQEDTIIFQLIERAQFARNQPVYVSEGVPVPGGSRVAAWESSSGPRGDRGDWGHHHFKVGQ